MPFEFQLDDLPAGYAMYDATGVEGTPVRVILSDFACSDQGESFLERLEGLPNHLLGKIPLDRRPQPAQVVSLVAVIARDKNVSLYVNEANFVAKARAARPLNTGAVLTVDDITDIASVAIENVDVPSDAGFVLLFSVGWRQGFFFDLAPLHTDEVRSFDLELALGAYFAYLSNPSIYKVDDPVMQKLMTAGWFPFNTLPKTLLSNMLGRAARGSDLELLVPKVSSVVRERLPDMLGSWKGADVLTPHMPLLERAAERYFEGDFMSCVSIVFPRIEGVLRDVMPLAGVSRRVTQNRMASATTGLAEGAVQPFSWLQIKRFEQFLLQYYFHDFRPGSAASASRHSIAHGVAPHDEFNEKHANMGFLILNQVFYILTA